MDQSPPLGLLSPVSPSMTLLSTASPSSSPVSQFDHIIPRKPVPGTVLAGNGDEKDVDHLLSRTTSSTTLRASAPLKLMTPGQSLFHVWWLELVACATAVIMLITTASILAPYQDKPLPQLPFHISINSVLSVLITAMKAGVLLTLAEGIGQLKWDYFRKRRPLKHLVTYDFATRGPWGCIQLIIAMRRHSLVASIGALLTLLAIIIEPFAQQLVQYYPCSIDITNGSIALIPRSNYYAESGPVYKPDGWPITVEQTSAVIGAVFNPSAIQTSITCLTGNCSFDQTYATLGYCAKCIDITDDIRTQNQSNSIGTNNSSSSTTSLSSGVWLQAPTIFAMDANSSLQDSTETVFEMLFQMPLPASRATSAANYSDGGLSNSQGYKVNCDTSWQKATWGCKKSGAARCVLKPCVKTFQASIGAGILNETLLQAYSGWHQYRSWSGGEQISMVDLDCVDHDVKQLLAMMGYNVMTSRFIPYDISIDPKTGDWIDLGNSIRVLPPLNGSLQKLAEDQLRMVPKQCIYAMHGSALQPIRHLLETYFTLNVSMDLDLNGREQGLKMLNRTYVKFDDFEQVFQAVARALSVRIRQWNWNSTDEFSKPVIGVTKVSETCIRVHWFWMLYPATITVSTVLFLAAVIAYTTTSDEKGFARAWKSSLLPLILHGIDGMEDGPSADRGKLDDLREMNHVAEHATGYVSYRTSRIRGSFSKS